MVNQTPEQRVSVLNDHREVIGDSDWVGKDLSWNFGSAAACLP
jgi:hypothetical protein